MITVRIHIENGNIYNDENVFITIKLPAIPNIGDIIYLGYDNELKLQKKACKTLEIAGDYYMYFKGHSSRIDPDNIKKENLKDLSFGDAIYVHSVSYQANSKVVSIEMTDKYLLSPWEKQEKNSVKI